MLPSAAQRRTHAVATSLCRQRVRDGVNGMTSLLIGGHLKAPCSSRFQNRIRPDPSQAKIFTRSARLARKTKIVPENGPSPSASRTSAARPSPPFLKSTGCRAAGPSRWSLLAGDGPRLRLNRDRHTITLGRGRWDQNSAYLL